MRNRWADPPFLRYEQAHGILYVIWLSLGTRCFCYYYVRLVATALFHQQMNGCVHRLHHTWCVKREFCAPISSDDILLSRKLFFDRRRPEESHKKWISDLRAVEKECNRGAGSSTHAARTQHARRTANPWSAAGTATSLRTQIRRIREHCCQHSSRHHFFSKSFSPRLLCKDDEEASLVGYPEQRTYHEKTPGRSHHGRNQWQLRHDQLVRAFVIADASIEMGYWCKMMAGYGLYRFWQNLSYEKKSCFSIDFFINTIIFRGSPGKVSGDWWYDLTETRKS